MTNWEIQRKKELKKIYYERWSFSRDQYTNTSYDEYGSKYQYCVCNDSYYLDKDGEITVHNEKELENLLRDCTNYYDGEETPSYTEEQIRKEIENFKKRRRIDIKETLKREKREREKRVRDEKRNEPLKVPIKQYIK